ncbi:MAG: flavin reductase [Caldilineae bacterium]|nr:MAG: flavin reductase [Caldilineae bacterium]GIV57171.1 MAG: hypothetical protein KatS3mg042_0084 [Rhodothermaceae bacterium]
MPESTDHLVSLDVDHPFWERFFLVHPLVVIGTREPDGTFDLAPKHMAMPMGWGPFFGFVCTPRHATYHNARREGAFTVSYPTPEQVVAASLSATARCDDATKPVLKTLPTLPARSVEGVLLRDAYLYLECRLERIVDGFGANSLIAGRVVAAHVHEDALRQEDRDDQEVLATAPLLAYLHPGRFATINASQAFPFPAHFKR